MLRRSNDPSREEFVMLINSKLTVLLVAALAISLSGSASAKSKRVRPKPAPAAKAAPAPPAAPPRQFFAANGVQPLTPEIEQALKPKDSFKECENCPEMVVVPKGSFMMGTPIT